MFNDEQRNFRRMQISSQAQLIPLDEQGLQTEELTVVCTDLSATGLAVEVSNALEVGSVYRVIIHTRHSAASSFDAIAKVVRASTLEDGTKHAALEIIKFN